MQRLTIVLSLLLGCSQHPAPGPTASRAPAPPELARARYRAKVDVVFAKTLAVFRAKYDNVEPHLDARVIKTAWHQFIPDEDDVPALAPGTRYFARFDIEIDGPPYAIAITPYVSTWHAGQDSPQMLPERRVWLTNTVADLRATINRELARYRVR